MGTGHTASRKRAQAGPVVDFWSYLAFILIVIVFFIIFQFSGGEKSDNKVLATQADMDLKMEFLNFMRLPVVSLIPRIDLARLNEAQLAVYDEATLRDMRIAEVFHLMTVEMYGADGDRLWNENDVVGFVNAVAEQTTTALREEYCSITPLLRKNVANRLVAQYSFPLPYDLEKRTVDINLYCIAKDDGRPGGGFL
ncbi:hypothetical protein JXB02_03935 [Candidatus Woesearchaeota archaeon]|nr:hypothetical protein [Candidatus Woesearchaeota archaeon]